MRSGPRDTLITLQRATTTADAYNEPQMSWADIGTEWAAVNYGRGDERREAAMLQGAQPATFTVLDNANTAGLVLKDRITFEGGFWNVTANAPGKRRGEREITAVKGV